MSSAKVSFWQDLVWRLQAFFYVLVTGLIGLMPVATATAIGGFLTRKLGPLTGSQKTVVRNFKIAFPDMDPATRARLIDRQWENLGRLAFEFPHMAKFQPRFGRVEIVNGERLEAIRTSGKPAVFVSGHFANWEVMPCVIASAGIDCEMTYRAPNNPYIDAIWIRTRAAYGTKLFAPKGQEGSRELLNGLKAGRSVALMNDQKFNEGLALPFMGAPAHTAAGPTRLALRYGADLQPMTVVRLPGARFRVVVHDPIELEHTGSRQHDLEAGVAKINAFVEAQVRAYPDQWFWVHKRWSNEAYAALDRKA